MKEIVKTGGHCADGCGWIFCDYYLVSANSSAPRLDRDVAALEKPMTAYCALFGLSEKYVSESLQVCNKTYGMSYKGKP
jgi:hypothetical protein